MQFRTALIDGDLLVYTAAAYAADHQQDELELEERIVADVKSWTKRAFATDTIVCLSGAREDNFRREVYPLYKTNRTDERPALLPMANEMIEAGFTCIRRKHVEADDLLGILATGGKITGPVIVSGDKDMRTIPGWHLNPKKEDFPVFVREDEALRMFVTQWLTGDRVDGYPGLKGIGPAKAEKLLNEAKAHDHTDPVTDPVVAALIAYGAAGHDVEFTLAMARCARILTIDNWDVDLKAPVLWTPTPEQWAEAGWRDGTY